MGIIPLDRRKAADIVHDRMRDMILSREWKADERIPSESVLCKLFGVSRVTIREATHRLVGVGLLCVRQGDGTYVQEVTPASLMHTLLPLMTPAAQSAQSALEFRALLEEEAARLAAIRAGDEDMGLLHEVLAEERRGGHTIEENALLDQLFHETIARASGNPLIASCMELVNDIISRSIDDVVGRMITEDALMYHWLILTAIEQHREKDAANAMRTHMERTLKNLLEQ